jgi:3-oxoacyl-[acyl-carrier-protein] synthase-3
MFRSVITGTGSYIPPFVQSNQEFTKQSFYTENQESLSTPSHEVIEKFNQITGIEERRYTTDELNASDIGSIAAKKAIVDSGIDPEEIDQLIVAHNFGNVIKHTIQTDAVPSLASHIKHTLGIRNPNCVAYDILFGCPGWLQGLYRQMLFLKQVLPGKH